MNELINLREAALRLLGGGKADEVLNDAQPTLPPLPDLPATLAAALRSLKTAAISADGMLVDYDALAASEAYRDYRSMVTSRLPAFDPATLTRDERLAFWINLYNGLILDGVVSYAVRRSVNDAAPAMGFFRRSAYLLGGQRLSAEEIEHGILRANAGNPFIPGPQFAPGDQRLSWIVTPLDPRLHFALNCASRSCPPIAAYSADKIEAQLELAARAFVDADTEVDAARVTLRISRIFSWYRSDFGGPEGLIRFVRAHLPDDERRRWLDSQTEIDLEFKQYDWSLNV